MTPFGLEIADPRALHAAAAALAPLLRAGDVVLLDGPLGVGKTAFVQGLAPALEVDAVVTSPTFAIANIYPGGRIPLLHVDAYRLESLDLFRDLALDEQMEASVTCIEWGMHVRAVFSEHLAIAMDFAPDGGRTAVVSACGTRWTPIWSDLRTRIQSAVA